MKRQMYICLFTFCGIFSQGSGILSERSIGEKSSDIQIRTKRVIDETPTGNRLIPIESAPYVVNVVVNGLNECTATLLGHNIAITSAGCFLKRNQRYQILSGNSKVTEGTPHNITGIAPHADYHPLQIPHDVALVRFQPPVDFPNDVIKLYNGELPAGCEGTVVSWGADRVMNGRVSYPSELQSIDVSILDQQTCQNAYRNIHHEITDLYVCTYYWRSLRRCAEGDGGAPLVVNGRLLGVMIKSVGNYTYRYPDVFVNLLDRTYRDWILRFVPNAADED